MGAEARAGGFGGGEVLVAREVYAVGEDEGIACCVLRIEIVREGVGDGDETTVAAAFEKGAKEGFALALGEVVDFKDRRHAEETAEGGGLRVAGVEEAGAETLGKADGAQSEVVAAEPEICGQPGERKFDGEAIVVLEHQR